MRIAVCLPQVLFVRGGAEILAETLVAELEARGHETVAVTVPFKWYPTERILTEALLWRLLDLDEANGRPVDLVIATKFPSYAVRHRNKVVWLVHQFRQAYEQDRTELGQFGESGFDRATRRAVHRLDARTLGEARRLFAISATVASRLERSTGLQAEVLNPPPQPLDYRCDEYGDFVLSVGRLERAKRVDLLVEAAACREGWPLVVVGDGPERERLERLAAERTSDGRVRFLGTVDRQVLADLYARCLAVYYAPVDEDFGLVPFEAFRAEKPVITTRDAGAPLDVVTDGESGLVCEPTPSALADGCARLAADPAQAKALGQRGKIIAERVTWDRVVDRLLAT